MFNFYEPDYRLPASGGVPGIHAPEFQLYNEASFSSIFNQQSEGAWTSFSPTPPTANTPGPVLDSTALLARANAGDHAGMVSLIDTLLFYGTLPPATRTTMVSMLDQLKTANRSPEERVTSLVQLAMAAPEFVVQR